MCIGTSSCSLKLTHREKERETLTNRQLADLQRERERGAS